MIITVVHIPALKIPPTTSQLESSVTKNKSNNETYFFIQIDLVIKNGIWLLALTKAYLKPVAHGAANIFIIIIMPHI